MGAPVKFKGSLRHLMRLQGVSGGFSRAYGSQRGSQMFQGISRRFNGYQRESTNLIISDALEDLMTYTHVSS